LCSAMWPASGAVPCDEHPRQLGSRGAVSVQHIE
jgi:hypothetical protein